jgi:hypothetical protein
MTGYCSFELHLAPIDDPVTRGRHRNVFIDKKMFVYILRTISLVFMPFTSGE